MLQHFETHIPLNVTGRVLTGAETVDTEETEAEGAPESDQPSPGPGTSSSSSAGKRTPKAPAKGSGPKGKRPKKGQEEEEEDIQETDNMSRAPKKPRFGGGMAAFRRILDAK